jgi:hypothetical protein
MSGNAPPSPHVMQNSRTTYCWDVLASIARSKKNMNSWFHTVTFYTSPVWCELTLSSNSNQPSEVKPITFNRNQECPTVIPPCLILQETPEHAVTPLQCSGWWHWQLRVINTNSAEWTTAIHFSFSTTKTRAMGDWSALTLPYRNTA